MAQRNSHPSVSSRTIKKKEIHYFPAGVTAEWALPPAIICMREKEALQHAAPGAIFLSGRLEIKADDLEDEFSFFANG